MIGLDGNKKHGCNKSITLKVNPKGNEMKATDGYIETCEVRMSFSSSDIYPSFH